MTKHGTRRPQSRDRSALAWALLTLFVVLALVAGLPAFHASVGLTQTDALDQGIMVPSVKLLTLSVALLLSFVAARLMASERAAGDHRRANARPSAAGRYSEHTVRDARSGLRMLTGMLRSGSSDPDAFHSRFTLRTLGALRIAPSRRITGGSFAFSEAVRMRI